MNTLAVFSSWTWLVWLALSFGATEVYCLPLVVSNGQMNAIDAAWQSVVTDDDPVKAAVEGGSVCELNPELCHASIGYGSRQDETGQVTLDAMVMDGKTMKAGCIGCLSRAKNAIRVAHAVFKHTTHTLLVGDGADTFAKDMGFADEDLTTNTTWEDWQQWRDKKCQPNKWIAGGLEPSPAEECGPYRPVQSRSTRASGDKSPLNPDDHDTLGLIVIDSTGNIATGTTTNGLFHKIHGRVGDSPIPGAGSYCENGVGAAIATGNGDVMLRFLPSFYAVERLREGKSPTEAAELSMKRMARFYPTGFGGTLVVVDVEGNYGGACFGQSAFALYVRSKESGQGETKRVTCISDITDAGALTKGGYVLFLGLHVVYHVFK